MKFRPRKNAAGLRAFIKMVSSRYFTVSDRAAREKRREGKKNFRAEGAVATAGKIGVSPHEIPFRLQPITPPKNTNASRCLELRIFMGTGVTHFQAAPGFFLASPMNLAMLPIAARRPFWSWSARLSRSEKSASTNRMP